MKNLSILIWLLVLFVQFGCAWTPTRVIASKEEISVDDLLSFKKSNTKLLSNNSNEAQKFSHPLFRNFNPKPIEQSSQLPEDVAFKLQVVSENGKKFFKVLYSPDGLKDQVALADCLNFLSNISNESVSSFFTSDSSIFELLYNVENGDPIALDNLLKLKSIPYQGKIFSTNNIDEDLKKRLSENAILRNSKILEIKQLNKQRKIAEASRRALIDSLDKSGDEQQFKSLVAKNDRKGVAELLKKYLPFEQMPPFEKRFWEMQIDIIEHPVELKNRVFIYRGLEDDFIHSAVIDGKDLGKETAIREGKAFLMSTVLVKNQGSWNRRLRSLQAMYEKYIATNESLSSEYTQSARITTMFQRHSRNPKGSPFLSFTPIFKIAKNFGRSRVAAFLVDPRVVNFNFTSGFNAEKEFLMPLVTFPDEMTGMWDKEIHGNLENPEVEKMLQTKLYEQLEIKYGKNQASELYESIIKRSDDFFAPIYSQADKEIDSGNFLNLMDKIMKNIVDGNKAVAPVAEIPSKNKSCFDLMKVFWAIP